MDEKPYTKALFEGLVFNEAEQPVEIAYLGDGAYYVILDDDFKRHVEARIIDQQVVTWLKEQIMANKDMVTHGVMSMMGKDDLFTKAMIDSSIKNVDNLLVQEQGIPEDARMWLGMMGFRIVVNVHGEVVQINAPAQEVDPDE